MYIIELLRIWKSKKIDEFFNFTLKRILMQMTQAVPKTHFDLLGMKM